MSPAPSCRLQLGFCLCAWNGYCASDRPLHYISPSSCSCLRGRWWFRHCPFSPAPIATVNFHSRCFCPRAIGLLPVFHIFSLPALGGFRRIHPAPGSVFALAPLLLPHPSFMPACVLSVSPLPRLPQSPSLFRRCRLSRLRQLQRQLSMLLPVGLMLRWCFCQPSPSGPQVSPLLQILLRFAWTLSTTHFSKMSWYRNTQPQSSIAFHQECERRRSSRCASSKTAQQAQPLAHFSVICITFSQVQTLTCDSRCGIGSLIDVECRCAGALLLKSVWTVSCKCYNAVELASTAALVTFGNRRIYWFDHTHRVPS